MDLNLNKTLAYSLRSLSATITKRSAERLLGHNHIDMRELKQTLLMLAYSIEYGLDDPVNEIMEGLEARYGRKS